MAKGNEGCSLADIRWEDYPILSGSAHCGHEGLKSGRGKGAWVAHWVGCLPLAQDVIPRS